MRPLSRSWLISAPDVETVSDPETAPNVVARDRASARWALGRMRALHNPAWPVVGVTDHRRLIPASKPQLAAVDALHEVGAGDLAAVEGAALVVAPNVPGTLRTVTPMLYESR